MYNEELNFDSNSKLKLDPFSLIFDNLSLSIRNQSYTTLENNFILLLIQTI